MLSLPIWSLTEEKVEELERLLRDKKVEFNSLESLHIFEIWGKDLDNFVNALQKYEEQEEKDRKAVKNVSNVGKNKGKNR